MKVDAWKVSQIEQCSLYFIYIITINKTKKNNICVIEGIRLFLQLLRYSLLLQIEIRGQFDDTAYTDFGIWYKK